jgi:hypothetical protein
VRAGNVALQISACSSLAADANSNIAYINTMLDKGATDTIMYILSSTSPEPKLSALVLTKAIATIRRGRLELLKPGNMRILGRLLQGTCDVGLIQSTCEVLSSLGNDADAELRTSFTSSSENNSPHFSGSSIVNRLMEITQGKILSQQHTEPRRNTSLFSDKVVESVEDPVLAQSLRGIVLTAAGVLAGATDSEESEWLVSQIMLFTLN